MLPLLRALSFARDFLKELTFPTGVGRRGEDLARAVIKVGSWGLLGGFPTLSSGFS